MRAPIALIILGLLLAYGCVSPPPADGKDYEEFAKCLTNASAKMYGAYWCGHCNNQKSQFGDAWQYVTYVECALEGQDGQTEPCKEAGVRGYPTWIFADGSRIEGEAPFEELSNRTGCALPSN